MRILGIDYGDKKIGLAFGDSDARVAVPLDVVPNAGAETIRVFAEQVNTENIDLIVVGVPISEGEHHSQSQLEKTRAFIRELQNVLTIPVVEEDESYTTMQSIQLRQEEGSPAKEDALAAMLIVQSYFETL